MSWTTKRISKLEKQVACSHVWEPRARFFMGEYFVKRCWWCSLEKSITKEEYASLNKGIAKRVEAELKEKK